MDGQDALIWSETQIVTATPFKITKVFFSLPAGPTPVVIAEIEVTGEDGEPGWVSLNLIWTLNSVNFIQATAVVQGNVVSLHGCSGRVRVRMLQFASSS